MFINHHILQKIARKNKIAINNKKRAKRYSIAA